MFAYNVQSRCTFVPDGHTVLLPKHDIEYYLKHGLFEAGLIEWSKQFARTDKCVIDVGAHTGTYTLALAPHALKVHAFEPQRSTFYALCGSVALSNLSNVECHRVALGHETGQSTLYVYPNGGGTSSLIPSGDGRPTETIEIRTLDSLGIRDVSFIKIDAEGFEPEVIAGALETLNRDGPHVLFEANAQDADKTSRAVALLQTIGYDVQVVHGVPNMRLAFRNK